MTTTTLLSDLFNLASAALWCVVYILIIRQAFRDRTFAVPFIAMCTNLMWEVTFSFVARPLTYQMDMVWFFLDLVILFTYIKFWRTDYPKNLSPKLVWVRLVMTCLAAAGLILATVKASGVHTANVHAAFGDNLVMSIAFIAMLVHRGNRSGQSLGIAWTKLLGTAAASIANYLMNPVDTIFDMVYWEILFFDVLYLVMLAKPSWWLSWTRPAVENPQDAQPVSGVAGS